MEDNGSADCSAKQSFLGAIRPIALELDLELSVAPGP
jgi:hypothetical protein